jgi:conjugal transfer pilus assembly protein TraI
MNELYKSIMAALGRFFPKAGRTEQPAPAPAKPNQSPIYNRTPYDIKPVDVRPEGAEGESHRYPPYLEGLPALTPERIIAEQDDLVRRIISNCDIEIERPGLVRKTLENYAAAVHLIPASEAHHHSDSGGLLRHGLEVANLALLLLNEYAPLARDHYAEQRQDLAPRLRYAVLVSALGHDLGKPVTDMAVADSSGKLKWNPMKETLYEWAQANGVERYFLHWSAGRNKKHEPVSVLMLGYVMGSEGREYIADVNPDFLSQAVESVSGDPSAANVIAKIVKRADNSSTERDQRRRGGVGGFGSGLPVERYYLDAMRVLARGPWKKINTPGGKIWVIGGDAYIVWPAAADDMQGHFMANKVKGVPFDQITILNELGDRGFLRPRVAEMGKQTWIWPIVPNELKTKLTSPLNSICLMSQDLLFDTEVPSVDGVKGADAAAVFSKNAKEAAPKAALQQEAAPVPNEAIDQPGETEEELALVDDGDSQPPTPAAPSTEGKKEPARARKPHEPKSQDVPVESAAPDVQAGEAQNHAPVYETGGGAASHQGGRSGGQTANRTTPPKISAEEAENNLRKKGLIGLVLVALAKDLNRRDPEIEMLKTWTVGDKKLLLLRAPEFFKDFHDDEELIREEASSSQIIQITEEGSVDWFVDDHRWWALNPEASMWFFALISAYIARYARTKGAAKAAEKPSPSQADASTGKKVAPATMPQSDEATEAPLVSQSVEPVQVEPASQEESVTPEQSQAENDIQPEEVGEQNDESHEASAPVKEPVVFEESETEALSAEQEYPSVENPPEQEMTSPQIEETPVEDAQSSATEDSSDNETDETGDQVEGAARKTERPKKLDEHIASVLEEKMSEGLSEISAQEVVDLIKATRERFTMLALTNYLGGKDEYLLDKETGMILLKGGK